MISSAFTPSFLLASQVSAAVPPCPTDVTAVVLGGGFRLPSVKAAPIVCNASPTLGGGFRLPSVNAVPVVAKSPLTVGGGFRMPAARPAPVTDRATISVGGGFRMAKSK